MEIRPLALGLRRVRGVHVDLHRQAARHDVFQRKTPRQGDPVLRVQFGVGRQRQHDLARHLRVPTPLRRLDEVPQHGGLTQRRIRARRQQHGVVGGRAAMGERERRAGALVRDQRPGVVGGRARGRAAAGTADVPGSGEGDGHA
ncbi:hypothetical protein BK022_17520 [Methylorubrum extorquens]|uniref:Uncharacterized protein n=1 Tax=Methylorubrum extorquens TaxID=408 RepID=A0A1S1P340_METEX|nr:hypothetical protein BK022_17520 [Methylorubrum extorquens]